MFRQLLENQKNNNNIAVIEGQNSFTFCQLAQKADQLKAVLPTDSQNVAVLLGDGGSFVVALWAIVSMGLTAFPLNVSMTVHEMLPLLVKAEVKTVVTAVKFSKLMTDICKQCKLNIIYVDKLESLNIQNAAAEKPLCQSHCPALLLNTSGTTGNCKIVQLTEKNIQTSFLGYAQKMQLFSEDKSVFMLAVPFCSAYGIMILSACLMYGFAVVVFDEIFTLNNFFKLVEKHKVTHYEGSATAVLLMEQFGKRHTPYDITCLKYVCFGGSKVSGKCIENVSKSFENLQFYQGYGMTEASPLIAKLQRGKVHNLHSVGTALSGVEIAVEVDGQILHQPDTLGEIVVKGDNVMTGYFKNPAETDKVLKNGYLYTGDIGYLDEQGYLYICGRKKNLINSRGFKVFPEEVEECILNSKLACDCLVYAKKDMLENEIVCADIVPVDKNVSIEKIQKYCSLHLAKYKQPQEINFCQSIVKNTTGKTDRRAKDK